uniref:Protein timeless 2 n=1 Tax=Chrysoperla nipponensis TaxID=413239 RepID=A0A9E9EL40_CHRNP|nr:protein timeless 2 [Chrysoperla nipponensis]
MSSYLEAEISATVNALGCVDANGEYQADVQVIESVKDLIRFLRRDDTNHEIRRMLGQCNVLTTDLLPMSKKYSENVELFDVLLRLLVNLTSPALLLYNEELPTDKTTRNHFLQLIGHLQTYKLAFVDSTVWAVLSTRLSKLLDIEWQERTEEMGIIIERILILVRNILQIPADPEAEKRPDNDASVHDQILWALHQSGMVDIFLYIATSENEQLYYMHILEITSLMLREQSAESLASSVMTRSIAEKEKDEIELITAKKKEQIEKQHKLKVYNGARHSRFGGTYVVKNMKSISNENDIIFHKPFHQLSKLNFDNEKNPYRKPKNKRPLHDDTTNQRRSAFSIRLFLKEYCIEFLNGAYNTLMYNVKDRLVRAKSQNNDETYYLWAIRFFMEFNRYYKFQVKLVSETMSVSTFHFIQQQMDQYYEMIKMDKKKFLVWSRRLHLGLRAYRELLYTLIAMDKSSDETVRRSSQVIKSNIFYVIEYSETVLNLMTNYDELKMSRAYLKDLIETQHVFLKMLEHFCKTDKLIVQKPVRTKSKKKKSKSKAVKSSQPTIMDIHGQWDDVATQISVVLENDGAIPKDIVPFDAASDVPIDDQKAEAMYKIQRLLRQHEYEQAIGFLRAAREAWPENNDFGTPDMSKDEEFAAIKEIFLADIQDETNFENTPTNEMEEEESDDGNEEEDEDEESGPKMKECNFNFTEFVNRFARPKVIEACGLALKQFDTNTEYTNHCIVKLLHRIAFDCKMPTMLFQATIFRTFQRILDNPSSKHKELAKFAIFIIRKFVEVAQQNPKVFMEMLFWKNSREAYEIEEGYGNYQQKSEALKKAWTEEQEDELRRLYEEYQAKNIEMNASEWITANLIENTRSQKAVTRKLKELGLLTSKPTLMTKWTNDDEEELRDLFEQFRDSDDVVENIVNRISTDRSKRNITQKLLALSLINDTKELKKKTKKARNARNNQSGSSDEDSDNNAGPSTHKSRSTNNKKTSSKKNTKKTKKDGAASKKESIQILLSIVEEMQEPLKWLQESISDTADDQEADADEDGVPLVPITEEESTAMENDRFVKLLKAMGFQEPDGVQENYWRIPGRFTADELREKSQLITDALEGTLELPNDNVPEQNQNENNQRYAESSSDDDDVFERVKKFMKNSDDEDELVLTKKDKSKKKISKKEFTQPEETNDLLNEADALLRQAVDESELVENSQEIQPKKKSRIVVSNDTDSENDETNVETNDDPFDLLIESTKNDKANTSKILDSDDENETKTKIKSRSKIVDSDDENETVTKSKSKVISDDESDNEIKQNKPSSSKIIDSDDENESITKSKSKIVSDEESDNTEKVEIDENNKRIRSIDDSDSESNVPKTKRAKVIISDDED